MERIEKNQKSKIDGYVLSYEEYARYLKLIECESDFKKIFEFVNSNL